MNGARLPWMVLACALLITPAGAEENSWRLGAAPGERLQYTIRWLGVPSGTATMQVEGGPGNTYIMQTALSTTGAARLFRSVDDGLKAEGRHHDPEFATRKYVKEQRRGDHARWTSYQFDREMRQVQRLHRSQTDHPEETTVIPVGTDRVTDPLSALYAVRAWPELLPDHTLERLIVDGEKVFCLTVAIGGGRTLHTALGDLRVFSLQVTVENSDLFRQRGPILLWLTDDSRRIPVQVEAQMAFGSVIAELVGYEDGRGESRSVQEQ